MKKDIGWKERLLRSWLIGLVPVTAATFTYAPLATLSDVLMMHLAEAFVGFSLGVPVFAVWQIATMIKKKERD